MDEEPIEAIADEEIALAAGASPVQWEAPEPRLTLRHEL
jgi:hypothetical protein